MSSLHGSLIWKKTVKRALIPKRQEKECMG